MLPQSPEDNRDALGMQIRPIASSVQCRAARGMLNWTRKMLAAEAGVALKTLGDFESDQRKILRRTRQDITAALRQAGIEFLWDGSEGVRLCAPSSSSTPISLAIKPPTFGGTTHASSIEFSPATVTITPELWIRDAHAPNVVAETAAMRRLAHTVATDPASSFQLCVELALELCHADTCGISLRERTAAGEDIFRWIALTGQLKEHLNGTTPRFFSPCGICVDANEPVLMRRPELVYKYLDVGPAFQDVLLIPLTEKGSRLEGTIWIVAHNPTRKFDSEDARVMQRLAVFTATTLNLANIGDKAKAEASEQKLLFSELDHRIKNTLTMAAGLLHHQACGIADPAARAAIESASRRLTTMGQIHEIGAHDAAGDLVNMIKRVCNELLAADPRFALKIDAEPVTVAPHHAVVVALIVNELVTNAAKHAFGGGIVGNIAVTLRRRDTDAIELSVTDDGVPLPSNLQNRPAGIGLNLVARLADQLAGELTVETKPKRFTVVFPATGRGGRAGESHSASPA